MTDASVDLTGWWVGYGIGAAVVVVVAAVVGFLIATGRRISRVARDITSGLERARDGTEALWKVGTTNALARDLLGVIAPDVAAGERRRPTTPPKVGRHPELPPTHTRRGPGG